MFLVQLALLCVLLSYETKVRGAVVCFAVL
jgi:hypothetical protein